MTISLIARAKEHGSRTAVIDPNGTYSYCDLLRDSAAVASRLLEGEDDCGEKRIAFLVPPGFEYVAMQWGIWRAGGIAVPLAISHPPAELAHVLDECDAGLAVAHPNCEERLREVTRPRGIDLLLTTDLLESDVRTLPNVAASRRAMMLFTSGTTGKPKGVVTTHAQIQAQITSLVDAWGWVENDRILLVLPLHHVHGIVNVLSCALWSGACCEIPPGFGASETWSHIVNRPLTLFMAVPTIYKRLIDVWQQAPQVDRERMSAACGRLRLMVSGSAALPVSVLERWKEMTGHVLLERYGMTEIGMGLSNPLFGERHPGFVGYPLPGVRARVVNDEMNDVPEGTPGELLIAGPNVFSEYWRRREETEASFHDGWFRTGDVVVVEQGRYRIMGRRSVDIIKTGGHKVSALEIEEVLRAHPAIRECAVVAVPDLEWGERVCVAVELAEASALDIGELRSWARDLLAPYKIPKGLQVVEALPRNTMGKVTKPAVAKLFTNNPETV